MTPPRERDILIADICSLLDAARRAGDQARHPPASWRHTIEALGYDVQHGGDAYAYARAMQGLAAATWRADARDYLNHLLMLTTGLRRSVLSSLPDHVLWEILELLSRQ